MASLNDLLADRLRERAVTLARYEAGVTVKANKLLKALERDLVARMAELDYFGDLTEDARAQMESTIQWARRTVSATFQRMDDKITQELRDLARVEGRWIEKQFNGQLDIKVLDTAMSPAGLASIVSNSYVRGLPSEEWWAGQSVKLQQAFAQQMRLGMTAGEPLGRLVQRVRGTQAEGFSDGIMQASSRDAKALIRTSVQSVANKTRETIYKANPDVVGEVQHVSTLDDRTTIICIARDGLRWTLDGEPVGHDLPYELPPLHWNCRSTLVPVTKTWREMGFDLDELSPTQRASMDGAVAADMTYEQWLKTKGEAFQDRVLGQGKAQLWRSGHIGLRDLLDQQGRPITLTRLEEEF